jgi:hypothetical protein
LSSITDAPTNRGQVLVIFALSLTVLILFAALAFDTGQMLVEKRDQQNAADAAAVAGSHFLPDAGPYDGDCTGVGGNEAARAACEIAEANGFEAGGDVEVEIHIPPTRGVFSSANGAVEVIIRNNRPSVFAGIMGVAGWEVSARAVAVNQDGVGASFAMLSLEPSDCDAVKVTGKGSLTVNGNIQVNSACEDGALHRGGTSTITVSADSACNVWGNGEETAIMDKGAGGSLYCEENTGVPPIPDPLAGLPPPGPQGEPADIEPVDNINAVGHDMQVPEGCPGAEPPAVESTEADPITCKFQGSYDETAWRLHPGDYFGGLQLLEGTFYLEPGIYTIAGGGLMIAGSGATAISVHGGTTLDFGVLLHNTDNPTYHTWCLDPANQADPLAQTRCVQAIDLAGGDANVDFYPLMTGSAYDGLVIYQDRGLDAPNDDLILNGSDSDTNVRGTIYVPSGQVKINGNGGVLVTDQIIADTYLIDGSGPGADESSVLVQYDSDFIFKFTAAGLVE